MQTRSRQNMNNLVIFLKNLLVKQHCKRCVQASILLTRPKLKGERKLMDKVVDQIYCN